MHSTFPILFESGLSLSLYVLGWLLPDTGPASSHTRHSLRWHVQCCLCSLYLLGALQNPGFWHKCSDWELDSGLVAITGHNESLRIVHAVGVNSDVVEMVPIHCPWHKDIFLALLCASVLDVEASIVVAYMTELVACLGCFLHIFISILDDLSEQWGTDLPEWLAAVAPAL